MTHSASRPLKNIKLAAEERSDNDTRGRERTGRGKGDAEAGMQPAEERVGVFTAALSHLFLLLPRRHGVGNVA